MLKIKNSFKLYDLSLMGYLNYIGMILFSSLTILAVIFYHDLVPIQYLNIFAFFSIYIIATSNINHCILPYKKQQPGLVFISKRLLLKHLFFTIRKGYSLQLLLACLISITFMFVLNQYLIIILALSTVLISFLSELTYGLFRILIRLLMLLQFWFILMSLFEISILVLIGQLFIIYTCISYSHSISLTTGLSFLNSSSQRRYASRNILNLFITYLINNKIFFLLLGVLASVITYFGQLFLNNIQEISALIFFYVNFATILEILIGSKKEEIMIDKARVETLQASLIVPAFKRFKSSSIYLISLTLIIVCVCGLIGIVLSTFDITIFLKSLLSIPLILFVGIVYFRKTELLVSGYKYKLLKLTLPIVMLVMITIFTMVS